MLYLALSYEDGSPVAQPIMKGVAYFMCTIKTTASLSLRQIDKRVKSQMKAI